MTTKLLFVALLVLVGCKKAPAGAAAFHGDLPVAEDMAPFAATYDALVKRTLTDNQDRDGEIAVRRPDGTWDDQGDATIFGSEVDMALDCNTGAPLFATLLKAISSNKGMIPSHNPLIPGLTPTSRDQVDGMMLLLVERWRNCPADRDDITAAWKLHVAYVNGNGGNLGPTSDGDMLTLRWLWGAVGQYLGVPQAGGGSKQEWEGGLITTAAGVNADHSACYPVHTGTLQAITAVKIGKPMSGPYRTAFCDATRGLELPMDEWFCERAPAGAWLSQFKPDTWIDRNQRCPNWEKPDAVGEEAPGADFLSLYILAKEGQG